uniref:Glutaredoxin domain-containing protein n=1 Tax=Fibrocapsa japonica TaxID=94617 RepID=A0A7S2V131_9STRA|mmetsp:Transcript_24028/g.34905  ORF Transcript_24028/g.34905 Transcript_24028/m.34905 type:complete len:155 (+) Transcript_24028:98-562(+)
MIRYSAICLLVLLLADVAFSFISSPNAFSKQITKPQRQGSLVKHVSMESESVGAQDRIKDMVSKNSIMLFMKGTRIFPQCGFSNTAVQILRACDVEFETFDVLEDPDIRQGIKDFSQWPTIPQLYVNGEFIGGCDIMTELYQNGEIKEIVGAKQ